MKKFGSSINFNGGPGEHNLQDIVKHKAQNTNRQAAEFTSQIATRNYKSTLINMAYTCICDKAGDFQYDSKVSNDLVSAGRFAISFENAHNVCHPGDRSNIVNWLDKRKDNLKIDINNNFKAVIAKNMTENGYCKGFAINGFTKCKLKYNK